jgi:hypothetical protein
VFSKHYRKCKLVNRSCLNNLTFYSCDPGYATEEQANQPNIHMWASQVPNYP